MTNRLYVVVRPLVVALGMGLIAQQAVAQDESLYPDAPAPDASFLRVLVPDDQSVAVDNQTLQPSDAGFTPYVEIGPGPVVVSIDGEETSVEAEANTHYTFVASTEAEGQLLTDGITGSPAQADLVFYNLSDIESADVFVPSADAMALEAVAPGAGAAVALRAPLTLDLEIRGGDQTVAEVAGVELVRSAGTTVVLEGEPGAYEARAELNTYAD